MHYHLEHCSSAVNIALIKFYVVVDTQACGKPQHLSTSSKAASL